MPPSIFTYLDYRQYLTDVFIDLHRADARFSQRKFGRMAGSTSPNFLQLISSRVLNISPKGVSKLIKALWLERNEAAYFKTLVLFDHAKKHGDKDLYFRKILLKREYDCIKPLDKNQYEYFSHWYVPVIRELATLPGYSGDPSWIARRIVPPVNVRRVKQGLDLLVALGLITRDKNSNAWVATDKVISTPSEVLSMAVTRYHRDTILLGREAIQRFGSDERDIRSVVMGLSKTRYTEVKQRLEAFWRGLLASSQDEYHVDQVYQVNMQLFPVSKPTTGRGRS